jgi:hypothetical protein
VSVGTIVLVKDSATHWAALSATGMSGVYT